MWNTPNAARHEGFTVNCLCQSLNIGCCLFLSLWWKLFQVWQQIM
jgi:hypothetical protein